MMFTFTFTEQMIKDIGACLENAPYRIAAPILLEIQKQINAQQQQPSSGNSKEAQCVLPS
ncbi:MAG TPA: hypothetical protein VH187_05580 [Scandinavium sp.]|jgi:hypothetical protein|uniref:hypothetical protein n=1 Tax=Scandinavium sp. TaxID=2830653 RepID=UPI002E33C5FF|nr:hypothetical protein [Scandinavium sp.]HEX4500632.1 hypothetical protein [Scandinavium sp.]